MEQQLYVYTPRHLTKLSLRKLFQSVMTKNSRLHLYDCASALEWRTPTVDTPWSTGASSNSWLSTTRVVGTAILCNLSRGSRVLEPLAPDASDTRMPTVHSNIHSPGYYDNIALSSVIEGVVSQLKSTIAHLRRALFVLSWLGFL